MNKLTNKYHRWVACSDDDQAYLGRCPDLFLGGVHGNGPLKVAAQLQHVIDQWEIEHLASLAAFPSVRIKPMMEVA
jgi:hypothetical protein